MLPALQFLDKEVVSLGDLAEFCVHSALEIDEVLPSFESIPGILVPLADDLVQVSHGYLGHKGLLNGPTKDSLHAGVTTLE